MLRRFIIWLVCLSALLGAYQLCKHLSGMAPVPETGVDEVAAPVADFNSQLGKLGEVGIGRVRVAEFVTHEPGINGVERMVFGFEELLHEQGDEWEVKGPYINLFMSKAKCFITARQGKIQVDSSGGKYNIKVAELNTDVVISIVSNQGGNECRLYLDDVTFISGMSQFVTDGPVKFVSEDATLTGRGLRLVYNEHLRRVEYLWIRQMDSLHYRAQSPLITDSGRVMRDREAGQGSAGKEVSGTTTAVPEGSKEKKSRYYRWTFGGNVVINAPQYLILADRSVSINQILWSKSSEQTDRESSDESSGERRSGTNSEVNRPAPVKWEPPKISDETIVVTCENGVLFAPVDSNLSIEDFLKDELAPGAGKRKVEVDSSRVRTKKTKLDAESIEHFLATGRTVAKGPLELVFYSKDITGRGCSDRHTSPVRVTAQKEARFLPASNKIVFEGSVVCRTVQMEPNSRQEYEISGPTLTLDLQSAGSTSDKSAVASFEIEHLLVGGGTVRLSAVRKSGRKVLSGVEIKGQSFEYDPAEQVFEVDGPGVVKAYNSSVVSEPNSHTEGLRLKNPYWVVIQHFASLKFFAAQNRISAEAIEGSSLDITYVPVVNGRYGGAVQITAGRIEALLSENERGQRGVSLVKASNGVTVKDGDRNLVGSSLSYESKTSMIFIEGDVSRPCFVNGVPADSIKYNLVTGQVSAEIVAPGGL